MKNRMMVLLLILAAAGFAQAGVTITGVLDGGLTGGVPKAVELYVYGTEDLTGWSVKNYNNGYTTVSNTTTLSGTYTNEFVYVTCTQTNPSSMTVFNTIWGSLGGDFLNVLGGDSPNTNGDDAIALHDASDAIVDVYGVIGEDGTGKAWEYTDSWAIKNDDAADSPIFNVLSWTIAPLNSTDGMTEEGHRTSVPFGTYVFSGDPNEPDPNIPSVEYTYGWEDGYGHILYASGNVYKSQDSTEQVHGGSHGLNVSVKPATSTTHKATLAWVRNLQEGDQVTAKVWAFDAEPQGTGYNSTRIVADYTNSADINEDYGFVTGGSAYTAGTGWEELVTTFTFIPGEEGQDAMRIAAMFSVNYDVDIENYYMDDITILAPEHASVVLPPAYDPNTYSVHEYGWENFDPSSPNFRETVLLGTYSAIQTGLEISEVHSGTKALWVSDDTATETPEGYMAWINGLQPGDYITVSCFGRSYAGQTSGGVRMWAHYTYDENDIQSYAGSASGYNGYSDPNEWVDLSKMWVFPDATYTDDEEVPHAVTGMVIAVRTYSAVGEGGFMDDLTIEVPQTATVTFPSMDGDAICVGGLPQWDFNADCIFNLLDLVVVIDDWLGCNLQPSEDCGL